MKVKDFSTQIIRDLWMSKIVKEKLNKNVVSTTQETEGNLVNSAVGTVVVSRNTIGVNAPTVYGGGGGVSGGGVSTAVNSGLFNKTSVFDNEISQRVLKIEETLKQNQKDIKEMFEELNNRKENKADEILEIIREIKDNLIEENRSLKEENDYLIRKIENENPSSS